MRRKDKELLDQKIVQEIFEKGNICRIAFSIDNKAQIVPVNYGYNDHKLYIHSAPRGSKIEWIRQNPKICFEIELPHEIITGEAACDWTTKYRSIIGHGHIRIEDHEEQKIAGLDIIMNAHGGDGTYEYNKRALGRMMILVIDIESYTAKQSGDW